MMTFLRHEQCPKCAERGADRSANNLGVWEDGHTYCFSCGFGNPGNSIDVLRSQTYRKRDRPMGSINYHDDASPNIRPDALAWLKRYGITDLEIQTHNILWSESKELLVFPIHEDMWQGRYFGSNPKYPKYVTYGLKDGLHIIGKKSSKTGERSSTIVLVEDLISAIKISRSFTSLPIFGSDINRRLLHRLKFLGFTTCVIWLDPNMKQQMLKFVKRAEFFFEKTVTVMSEKDPKYYSDGEINEYITKSLQGV